MISGSYPRHTLRAALDAFRFVLRGGGALAWAVVGFQVLASGLLVTELLTIRVIVDRFVDLDQGTSLRTLLTPMLALGALAVARSTSEVISRELQWAVGERTERVVVTEV